MVQQCVKCLLVAACYLLGTGSASAGVVTASLPLFNGSGINETQTWGTLTFTIPAAEFINPLTDTAMFSGQFGNDDPLYGPVGQISGTSIHQVFADGIEIARCDYADACYTGPGYMWNYILSGANLSILDDGEVVITTTQTDCCIVRQGPLTLMIGTTSVVPEPHQSSLLLGGLLIVYLQRKRLAGALSLFQH